MTQNKTHNTNDVIKSCGTCHFACDCREAKFMSLEKQLQEAKKELLEQCHVNAMSAERELKLMQEIKVLKNWNKMLAEL